MGSHLRCFEVWARGLRPFGVWGRTFGAFGYEVIVIRTAQKRAKRVSQKMLAFSMTECSRGRQRRQRHNVPTSQPTNNPSRSGLETLATSKQPQRFGSPQ